MSAYGRGFKRLLDTLLALILLSLTVPLICFFAVAIAVEDPGTVFFRQVRIGRNGKPFTLLKLRTMSVSRHSILDGLFRKDPELRRKFEQTGVIEGDPRIVSRAARLARQFYIDELPQSLNILWGTMSFVGPRPMEEWLARTLMSEREMACRTRVRPGLTGLAQIHRRSKADIGRRMVHLDLLYVRRISLKLDLRILFATPRAVFAGGGIEPASQLRPISGANVR